MPSNHKVIIHPYSSAIGESLLEILIAELSSGKWTRFQSAVAFLKPSGHFESLLAAMLTFVEDGGELVMTFGSDLFGDAQGSDFDALTILLELFADYPQRVNFFLYHERGRTFHPKLYLFANEQTEKALISVGPSNWSRGGLLDNVEVNLLLELDLSFETDKRIFDDIQGKFQGYWVETEEKGGVGQGFVRRVTLNNLDGFSSLLSTTPEQPSAAPKPMRTSTPKVVDPKLNEAESLFDGKRVVIPKRYQRRIQRRARKRPSRIIPKFKRTAPTLSQRYLLWRKPKLAASDVQRQKGHPTGGVRLTQAKWEVDGQIIDQTSYFRDEVFGNLEWTIDEYAPKSREVALVNATIRILGEDYGRHDFKISHKPSGEAGQGNYTTLLHWWGLTEMIWKLNLVGKKLELYAPDEEDTDQVYHIEIS